MPSPADRELAARDRALPGLALLLDPAALAERPGFGRLSEPYLRYEPGTSAALAFRPEVGEALAAFTALAYPPARYAEVRARPS